MAYQGSPTGGYGQVPPYYPAYHQQNQVPYTQNTAPRSNPIPSYQGNLPTNSNFDHSARQVNSFSPAISFPSSIPSYPTTQYPPAEQTWSSTAQTRSDLPFSQPPPKRQRIESSQDQFQRLQQAPKQQNHPALMANTSQLAHPATQVHQSPTEASNTSARVNLTRAQPKQLEPDAQYKLLLPLAEEFFEAAYALGPSVAKKSDTEALQSYQRLIATGLSCLEGALKNRMPPRLEAKVRIRYASVLYSDTLNYMEAEVALSKGITLCERNHLVDLKYHMQYLLAKVMYKKSPKAAYKSLDLHVDDASAYKHYSWVYAFRFLRATLSLESGNSSDTHIAMDNLHQIADLAHQREDRAIFLASALFQARVYFRSGGPESIEHIQRAIAVAWSYQLDERCQIPQLMAMTHILDVSCSLLKGIPNETVEKMNNMRTKMDSFLDEPSWNDSDDQVAIPIFGRKGNPQAVTSDTRAVLDVSEDGTEQLMVSWFDRRSMFAISYFLCGISLLHADCHNGKAQRYLAEGLKLLSGSGLLRDVAGTAPELRSQHEWRETLLCYFHIYLAFCHAARTDWAKVGASLKALKSAISDRGISTEGPLGHIINYLSGVYFQGTGDLDGALQVFESKEFSLRTSKSIVNSVDQMRQDLSLLAAMNALWIYQEPIRLDPSRNSRMIEQLEPLCKANRHEDFQLALNLLKATVKTNPHTPNIKVKNYLVDAMTTAKRTSNTQLLCITLNVMSHRFFTDIVGTQAEKSSRAASHQAKRSGNKLWMSVADGGLASCLEIQQQLPEATKARENAIDLARKALSK